MPPFTRETYIVLALIHIKLLFSLLNISKQLKVEYIQTKYYIYTRCSVGRGGRNKDYLIVHIAEA